MRASRSSSPGLRAGQPRGFWPRCSVRRPAPILHQRYDPHGPLILTLQEVPDDGCCVRFGWIGLDICQTGPPSRFTAGCAEFFILSQSGERPSGRESPSASTRCLPSPILQAWAKKSSRPHASRFGTGSDRSGRCARRMHIGCSILCAFDARFDWRRLWRGSLFSTCDRQLYIFCRCVYQMHQPEASSALPHRGPNEAPASYRCSCPLATLVGVQRRLRC